MDEQTENKEINQTGEPQKKVTRRHILKSLATIPVVGAFAYGVYKKKKYDRTLSSNILQQIGITQKELHPPLVPSGKKQIRLGIIGYGIRGHQLMEAAGFVTPEWVDSVRTSGEKNQNDKRYEEFLNQENLNVVVNGVCDLFDFRANEAMKAGANVERKGTETKPDHLPKRYRTYKELIAAQDIDAVIIATPDHWHAPITIEAANHGKHVYCEKAMTHTLEEAFQVREAVKRSNIVFQLGHQGRQTASYMKAREAIQKNVLGKVTLIEVTTNRNTPNGAWVYPIHPGANEKTIDWKQFIGDAPWHEFSLERFFRWRCWWDYGTGLFGDLLTHEYDAMNQIFDLGIPRYSTTSGGIYYFKDGRNVPDVQQTTYEYPNHDLTLLYSASLASSRSRGKVIMGHDASMELGNTLSIKVDRDSTRYAEQIKNKTIDPSRPVFSYIPGRKNVDALSSATEQYFAGRGLLYTYRNGQRVNTTHLHIKEWLEAIRNEGTTSCNIDRGFEEAVTAMMGVIAYKEGRRTEWDPEKERMI